MYSVYPIRPGGASGSRAALRRRGPLRQAGLDGSPQRSTGCPPFASQARRCGKARYGLPAAHLSMELGGEPNGTSITDRTGAHGATA